tara:strand:- start:339 stop:752 length:414 start_codon:yes stop_codon:yes gene_type:complete
MAIHKHNSWGRTRCPKNIAGPHGTEAAVVLVGTLTDVADGYATENQRYLHVLATNGAADDASAAARTVTLYGYSHATAMWTKLSDPGGALTATAPDNNGVEAVAGRYHQMFDINGIDRIAFVGVAADVKVWASCSTF